MAPNTKKPSKANEKQNHLLIGMLIIIALAAIVLSFVGKPSTEQIPSELSEEIAADLAGAENLAGEASKSLCDYYKNKYDRYKWFSSWRWFNTNCDNYYTDNYTRAVCTDSDGGINIRERGITSGTARGTINFVTEKDYCITDGPKKGRLAEFYCAEDPQNPAGNRLVGSETFGPENGCAKCVEGTCLRAPPCGSYGDVNLDGFVTANDVQDVLSFVVGRIDFTQQQRINADVRPDGDINAGDAGLILRYISNGTSLPVCEQACTRLYNAIQLAFRTSCGDKNYNFIADINRDKAVNLLDMTLFSDNANNSVWCATTYLLAENPC